MGRVRHYQTITTYSKNGVRNRTVRSRSAFWGPYASPEDKKAGWAFFFLIIGLFLLFGWPWMIKAIPMWARGTIAGAWYFFLLVLLSGYAISATKRHRAAKSPSPSGAGSKQKEPRSKAPTSSPPSTYREAYKSLKDEFLQSFDAAMSPKALDELVATASRKVRETSKRVPEFYIGEFLEQLRKAVIEHGRTELRTHERVPIEAKARADVESLALTTRLSVAREAGDEEAEHAIWHEREVLEAEVQSHIDAAANRVNMIALWPNTVGRIASELGFTLSSPPIKDQSSL